MSEASRQQRRPFVLIADDMPLVAAGTCALLKPEYDVVGIVHDGRALVTAARRLRPEIILTEVLLPLLNGLDAARYLAKTVPESKIVFLTLQTGSAQVADAFKAGASAYLLKRSQPCELSQALQAVLKGQYYLTPLITKGLLGTDQNGLTKEAGKTMVSSLTPRQREVLQLLAEGRGTKEVATLLNIAVTVALARHAIAEGLIRL